VTRHAIVISDRAQREIDRADRWWRRHRDARDLLRTELTKSSVLIADQPDIGRPAPSPLPGTRKLTVPRTGYVLYYRVHPVFPFIEILALWHARRRREPRL
jgi:plasmid stabilization system protein ParE